MICEICGKNSARRKQVDRSYGKRENLMIIENIPVIKCSACGESYMTAETLHEIERIKLQRQSFAVKRNIPVADFC